MKVVIYLSEQEIEKLTSLVGYPVVEEDEAEEAIHDVIKLA